MTNENHKTDNAAAANAGADTDADATTMSRPQRCFWGKTVDDRFAAWLEEPEPDEQHARSDFTSPLLRHVKLKDYTGGPLPTATFEYTVQRAHCNPMTLHGGCTASLFDVLTGMTLLPVQRPGFWELLGVSRNLSITYLRPAFAGDVLTVHCEVVSIGRRMAHIKGTIRNEAGDIVSMASHDKADIDKSMIEPRSKL
ncbi:hypothetical protein BROUX41_005287 [Berkeleyomyces rouxiae]|uniref:uncharacterized protein n=1 Tax=Berkeleyomyces rouxiae TaxID=2035830 RepID=UPI003B776890